MRHPVENESSESEQRRTKQLRRRVHLGLSAMVHVKTNVDEMGQNGEVQLAGADLAQFGDEFGKVWRS